MTIKDGEKHLPFTSDEISEAIRVIVAGCEEINIKENRQRNKESSNRTLELIVVSEAFGPVSVNGSNLKISWKSLLLSLGSSLYSANLTALSLLSYIAKGVVHRFDKIDAEILLVIYKNKNLLPAETKKFYYLAKGLLGPKISEDLYMERIVSLAMCGAISIDSDIIVITDRIYTIDFTMP